MAGLINRWENYRASKTMLFWSCAACSIATMVVGFAWGGWVTGGTAADMATKAGQSGRAEIAASVCVDRFTSATDAVAQLAVLKKTDQWQRNDFIQKGGWVTLPGTTEPVTGAATLCADRLMEAKLPPVKAAGTSG